MRPLSTADLLSLWERGLDLHPVERGVLALQAAYPETPFDRLADWQLGHRNCAVAELHCACFNPRLDAWTTCPSCAEKLEFQMDARSLAVPDAGDAGPITVNGHSFRLPTSRDLAHIARKSDATDAALCLLQACHLDGEDPPMWSEKDIDQVGEEMALADPMAETRLALNCPCCANRWNETLDIVTFFWAEVEARARGLLREVHTLASAYGWTEAQVVSLSATRRAFYLECCHA